MGRNVYNGYLKLTGEESRDTLLAALNYAVSLNNLDRFEEAKSLLRKTIPVTRRVIGDGHELTLKMRWNYAQSLYKDAGATLDDLREAVGTLVETARTARRALGGAHPFMMSIEHGLQQSREVLRARDGGDVSAVRAGLDAMTVRKK